MSAGFKRKPRGTPPFWGGAPNPDSPIYSLDSRGWAVFGFCVVQLRHCGGSPLLARLPDPFDAHPPYSQREPLHSLPGRDTQGTNRWPRCSCLSASGLLTAPSQDGQNPAPVGGCIPFSIGLHLSQAVQDFGFRPPTVEADYLPMLL